MHTAETELQNKRTLSTANLAGSNRAIKRRASKACGGCRGRKVRCDVVNGSPCTNCRLDQVECLVPERTKIPRVEFIGGNQTPESSTDPSKAVDELPSDSSHNRLLNNVEDLVSLLQPQDSLDLDGGQHKHHLICSSLPNALPMARVSFTEEGSIDHPNPEVQMQRGRCAGSSLPNLLNIGGSNEVTHTTQQVRDPSFINFNPSESRLSLPKFIKGLPRHFLSDDIEYLANKGALTVPEPELRHELVKSYIHYVHWYMPILDLEQFLQTTIENNGIHRISLLLFQAVMFAAAAFVDIDHLHAAGYPSRNVARKIFFQRVRLLYDFDYEMDQICLVQSLLLMTYWYDGPDDQKDTWHWMGAVLSLAHTIGLHRDPGNSMDQRHKRLCKRIWWSTYSRDRLIALGMRRPMRIKDGDYNMPLVTIDDFEFTTFSPQIVSKLGHTDVLQNIHYQKQLAMMFIEKTKLCICVSHVLSAQYATLRHTFGAATVLVPKKPESENSEVSCCDKELEYWETNLPLGTEYQTPASRNISEAEEILYLHCALLRMIYLTTSSALHRPQVLPHEASSCYTVETGLQHLSRDKVRDAAIEITNIAQEIDELNLTRYLPTTGVTVLLSAVIIHLLDIKSIIPTRRVKSLHRFYHCMQILQQLKDIYASADFAVSFLESAIQKAGVQVTVTSAAAPTSPESQTRLASDLHYHTLTPSDSATGKISDLSYPDANDIDSNFSVPANAPPHTDGSEAGGTDDHHSYAHYDVFHTLEISEPSLSELVDLGDDFEITENDLDALYAFDNAGTNLFASEDGDSLDMTNDGPDIEKDTLDCRLEFSETLLQNISSFDDTKTSGNGLERDIMSSRFTDNSSEACLRANLELVIKSLLSR